MPLRIQALDDRTTAPGDMTQVVRGDRVESRCTFRFQDGSVHDETVVFSQRGAFKVLSYRLVQTGPVFPQTLDASFDRASGGRYTVKSHRGQAAESVLTGTLSLPDDVYNGMVPTLVKHLAKDRGKARVHFVAFMPKPRLIELELQPVGEEPVRIGGTQRRLGHYVMKPRLGRFVGLFASLLGKRPSDYHSWFLLGDVPVFARFEGALDLEDRIWRVEPTATVP